MISNRIIEEIQSIKSGYKELRQFGLTVGIVLILLGGLVLWKGHGVCVGLFVIGGLLIVCGFVAPKVLKPAQKAWMIVAMLLGWVVSRVLLTIFFYLVLAPCGIITRLLKKELLDLQYKKEGSYWNMRSTKSVERSDYERQF